MTTTDTVIIGAGHAGLAMSHCLTGYGIEHVVLERGQVAQRWRSDRWDSCRLLTPNWLSRLPGWSYQGDDPDGFMSAAAFADHLSAYARTSRAPVLENTTVIEVRADGESYLVDTDAGTWRTRCVVIATGYHSRSLVPALSGGFSPTITQIGAAAYRNPTQLPAGGVLVVGASSTGVQIADELARSGREVTLAVGEHTRMPRRYGGRDMLWWLDRLGSLDRTLDEVPDPHRARREPSFQLAAGRALDLGVLRDRGVRLAGRLVQVDGRERAIFADDLQDTTTRAENRLRRVLGAIDRYAGFTRSADIPGLVIDGGLRQVTGLSSVVWATGFRPVYPWLRVPVLDSAGHLRHRRGITDAPGLYAVGLRFQHRRNATLIDGARHDAAYLAEHIAVRLRHRSLDFAK
ncbi:FAD-dependent oxidoreductase [Micromonospora sp. NPDC049366]|uniref:FAD-dependent oxidoreductase n=1 Tax=Micromonospora sp. NPDC049366 TaxID=3364271 RepID=UPI0037919458